jgi:hypothetical protein
MIIIGENMENIALMSSDEFSSFIKKNEMSREDIFCNEEILSRYVDMLVDTQDYSLIYLFDADENKYPLTKKYKEKYKHLLIPLLNDIRSKMIEVEIKSPELIDYIIDNKLYKLNYLLTDMDNPKIINFFKECLDKEVKIYNFTPELISYACDTGNFDLIKDEILADYKYADDGINNFLYYNDELLFDLYNHDYLNYQELEEVLPTHKLTQSLNHKLILDRVMRGKESFTQYEYINKSEVIQLQIVELIKMYPEIIEKQIASSSLIANYPIFQACLEYVESEQILGVVESLCDMLDWNKCVSEDFDLFYKAITRMIRINAGIKNSLIYDIFKATEFNVKNDIEKIKQLIDLHDFGDEEHKYQVENMLEKLIQQCNQDRDLEKQIVDIFYEKIINDRYVISYEDDILMNYFKKYKRNFVIQDIENIIIDLRNISTENFEILKELPKEKIDSFLKNNIPMFSNDAFSRNLEYWLDLDATIALKYIEPSSFNMGELYDMFYDYPKEIEKFIKTNKDKIEPEWLVNFPEEIIVKYIRFKDDYFHHEMSTDLERLLEYSQCYDARFKILAIIRERLDAGDYAHVTYFPAMCDYLDDEKLIQHYLDNDSFFFEFTDAFKTCYKTMRRCDAKFLDEYMKDLFDSYPEEILDMVSSVVDAYNWSAYEVNELNDLQHFIVENLYKVSNKSKYKYSYIHYLAYHVDEQLIIDIIEKQNYKKDEIGIFFKYDYFMDRCEKIKEYLLDKIEKIGISNVEDYLNIIGNRLCNEKFYSILKNNNCITIDSFILLVIHEKIKEVPREFFMNHIDEIMESQKIPNDKKKNLIKLFDLYGTELIANIKDDNLKRLILFTEQELDRYIEIFKQRKLTEEKIKSINNSLNLYKFEKDNSSLMNSYTIIMGGIQNGNKENLKIQYRDILSKYIDRRIIDFINPNLSNEEFIDYLFDQLEVNQYIYAELLHDLIYRYIIDAKNEASSKEDIYKDCDLFFRYDDKQLFDMVFNRLLSGYSQEILNYVIAQSNPGPLTVIDFCTIKMLIGDDVPNDKEKLKKNIPNIKRFLKSKIFGYISDPFADDTLNAMVKYDQLSGKFVENKGVWSSGLASAVCSICNNIYNTSNIKKIIKLPIRQYPLSNVLSSLDFKEIKKVIDDDELYKQLKDLLDKYCFLDWDNIFNKYIPGEDNEKLFYHIINNFSQMIKEEINSKKSNLPELAKDVELLRARGISEEKINDYINEYMAVKINPAKLVKYAEIYKNQNFKELIWLLGSEDSNYIINNPAPNSAGKSVDERAPKIKHIYLKSFAQRNISIPSYEKVYEYKDKKLDVIVGNRTAPFNMTHGERTGACMRAYGVADNLFEFTATDVNGFHITFIDPKTNEYISRISGFRNGDTVFLNQLRYSLNDRKYSNNDLYEILKLVGKDLIELTKNDKLPIANVVADKSYALKDKACFTISPTNDIGKEVYDGYHDVSNHAVVLASTANNYNNIKVKLGPRNHPTYSCVRLKPKELYDSHLIFENIVRIDFIKSYLNNDCEFDSDIVAEQEKDNLFKYALVGDDWYVAIDKDNKIISSYIEGDSRLFDEYNEALDKVNQLVQNKNIFNNKTL